MGFGAAYRELYGAVRVDELAEFAFREFFDPLELREDRRALLGDRVQHGVGLAARAGAGVAAGRTVGQRAGAGGARRGVHLGAHTRLHVEAFVTQGFLPGALLA